MKAIRVISIIILLVLISVPVFAQDDDSGEYGRDIIKTESGSEEFKANRIAVIIGINDYLNIKGLKFATPDALAMKDVLEEQGAFTIQYIGEGSNISPTKYNILKTLNDVKTFSESVDTLKTFVFYFAGHGFNIDGENYLAPMDVNPDNIQETGIHMDEVFAVIKEIQKKAKVMMFIDACRNDPLTRGGGDAWSDVNSRGTKVLYSTSEGDFSYELPELEHGVYTLHLTQALKGLADLRPHGNEDGYVSFEEASKYVASKMLEFSTDNPYDISQTPRVEMMEVLGDFYITIVDETEIKLFNDIASVADISEEEEFYSDEYFSLVKPIYDKLREYIDDENTEKAIESCNSILRIISQYENEIELTEDKENIILLKDRLEKVIDSNKLIDEGDAHLSEKKFDDAMAKYSNALTIIRENNLQQFIPIGSIAELISRIRIAKNIRSFIDTGDEALINGNYDNAKSEYQTALTLLEENDVEDLIAVKTVELKIENIEYVVKARLLIKQGKEAYDNEDYRSAHKNYDEALSVLINNSVDEKYVDRQSVEDMFNRLSIVVKVMDMVEKADTLAEEGEHGEANDIYNQCIDIIKENSLQDIFSVSELESKLGETPLYKKLYINASGGVATSLLQFGSIIPAWNIGITYRLSRSLSIGAGINLFSIEAFGKYSLINTLFIDNISSEFVIKANAFFNTSPLFIGYGPFGVGGGIAFEYIIGINGVFGIHTGLRTDIVYNFSTGEESIINIPVFFNLGIVYYL